MTHVIVWLLALESGRWIALTLGVVFVLLGLWWAEDVLAAFADREDD